VVDDEKSIVRLVGQSLSKRGYRVTHFPDAGEALEYFRENAGSLDLLLTDLSMPAMRGDELGTKVRELRPGFPVLIMTGFGGFLDLATFSREGPTAILPKPFSSEALLHAVEGVMREAAKGKVSSP
jgi:DNA-binding NtrC family response regulator